jgi:acetylornithine deacetylase
MFGRPAYEIASDHPLPKALSAALAAVGGAPRTVGASFWADSAVLGHAGIPSVLFGPGGAGLHSTEEFVKIDEVLRCRDALVEMTGRFCGTPRPGRG